MSRSLEFVELIINVWDYKVCDSMPCTMRSAMLFFYSAVLPVCAIHKCKFITSKVQSDDWQYVFCKDYCLVLIVKCLFAKASTANAGAELLKLRPRLREHQLIFIKATYSNTGHLGHTLKVAILTSYKKWSVWYFKLKLHIHTLGISETCFTSCKKEHNRSV